jgi:hypothetical protein
MINRILISNVVLQWVNFFFYIKNLKPKSMSLCKKKSKSLRFGYNTRPNNNIYNINNNI